MKIIHSAIFVLLSAASISTVQARDSFSFGFSSGGGYPPPVFYSPPVTFYNPPVVYYSAEPSNYHRGYYNNQPVITYQYADNGFRGCRRDGRHEERDHHGWGHDDRDDGGRNHGNWGRGHHDDD